ncbi:MAG: RNA-binding S4 domain-containing protein [Burkholderiales bacterium]
MSRKDSSKVDDAPRSGETCRLDKWLWAARLFKTRALACAAIESGQVRVNDARVKPSRAMRPGDRLLVRKAGLAWVLTVSACSTRRGSASEAALLYAEDPASVAARQDAIQARRAGTSGAAGRPTKRDRRSLEDFLSEP